MILDSQRFLRAKVRNPTHGEAYKETDRVVMDKVQDYLRRSIRETIKKNETIDDMNKKLDLC